MRLSSKSHNFVNLIYKSITRVPAIIITRPMLDFTDSFSLKTMYEKTIETTKLNLSIGTTALAGPSCKALTAEPQTIDYSA